MTSRTQERDYLKIVRELSDGVLLPYQSTYIVAYRARTNRFNRQRRKRLPPGRQISPIRHVDVIKRLAQTGWGCYYCDGPFESWDHLTPLGRGGNNDLPNLVPSCRGCNNRKADMTEEEFKYARLSAE